VIDRAGAPYIPPGDHPMQLLAMGGSQGARILSDVVPAAIAALPEDQRHQIRVAHQARDEDVLRVAPFVVVYLLARPRVGIGITVTSVAAAGFSAAWLPTPWLETLLGPLRVATALGAWSRVRSSGDLHRVLSDLDVSESLALTVGLTITGLLLVLAFWFGSRDPGTSMAAASVISLVFFPHFPYDYLILVVALAYGLSRSDKLIGMVLSALSGVVLVSPQYLLKALGYLLGNDTIHGLAEGFAWPMSVSASRGTFVALLVCLWLTWMAGRPGAIDARARPSRSAQTDRQAGG
jgi:hypothetical protein